MTEQEILKLKEELKKEIIKEIKSEYFLKSKKRIKKSHSQETKENLSNACKTKKPIKCLSDGLVFESIRECAKFYKIGRATVYRGIPLKFVYVNC